MCWTVKLNISFTTRGRIQVKLGRAEPGVESFQMDLGTTSYQTGCWSWPRHFGQSSELGSSTSALLVSDCHLWSGADVKRVSFCPTMWQSCRTWRGLYDITPCCVGEELQVQSGDMRIITVTLTSAAAAAAKSHQSCPTLCDPIDGSLPGSPVPGIFQARTLEWVATSFSNAWKWKVKVKSLSHVRLPATPWTAAHQAPPSMGFSRQEYWSGVPLRAC